MKFLKKALKILICVFALCLAIFAAGRYGWKLFGFSVCESAGIEQVTVEENRVRVQGFYPGPFPKGFLGYHAKQEGDKLYIGFKFSGIFGIFETGRFDITVPVEGEISEVIIKTNKNEFPIPKQEDFE